MKLWLIEPHRDDVGEIIDAAWSARTDMSYGFVIRADSEAAARTLAAEGAGDEGREVWLSAEAVGCKELTIDGEADIILAHFYAG